MSNTALIVGGAGFIGSHLTETLLAKEWKVYVLDDLSTGSLHNLPHNPNLKVVIGSALDKKLVEKYLNKADVVYHLAAVVGADLVVKHPILTVQTNIQTTENILSQAKVPVLVASTSEVYGKLTTTKFSEDDDLVLGSSFNPRWCYAASKIVDEHLAVAHKATVVRLFNTIGPRQTSKYGMVVPRFIEQSLAGYPITIYGDGSQRRSFTWVKDVVNAMTSLMELPSKGQIYNIGHTEDISVLELAMLIRQLTNSTSKIVYEDKFEDMARRLPDLSRIEAAISYKPTLTLTEMLRQIISHKRHRHENTLPTK